MSTANSRSASPRHHLLRGPVPDHSLPEVSVWENSRIDRATVSGLNNLTVLDFRCYPLLPFFTLIERISFFLMQLTFWVCRRVVGVRHLIATPRSVVKLAFIFMLPKGLPPNGKFWRRDTSMTLFVSRYHQEKCSIIFCWQWPSFVTCLLLWLITGCYASWRVKKLKNCAPWYMEVKPDLHICICFGT